MKFLLKDRRMLKCLDNVISAGGGGAFVGVSRVGGHLLMVQYDVGTFALFILGLLVLYIPLRFVRSKRGVYMYIRNNS